MGRLASLLTPFREGLRMRKGLLLAVVYLLGAWGGAFGIALAVVEWRDEVADLTAAEQQIGDIDSSVAELGRQLDQIETSLTMRPSPTAVSTPAPSPTLTPAPTPEPTPTPSPAPEPGATPDNPVPLGQPLLLQGWEMTIVDWCCGPTEGRAASVAAVRLRAVNVSAGELASLPSLSFSVVLSTGVVQKCFLSSPNDLLKSGIRGATLEGLINCSSPPNETGPFLIGGRFFALE